MRAVVIFNPSPSALFHVFFPTFNFFTWYYYSGACIVLLSYFPFCRTFPFVLVLLSGSKDLSKFTSSPRAFLYVSVPSIRIRTS
jgi:hypothetical protein